MPSNSAAATPPICPASALSTRRPLAFRVARALPIAGYRDVAFARRGNPDFFSRGAIVEYAWKQGREGELREIDLPRKRDLEQAAGAGSFNFPGLFEDSETISSTL